MKVLIFGYRTGATGLNLHHMCSDVILLEPPGTPKTPCRHFTEFTISTKASPSPKRRPHPSAFTTLIKSFLEVNAEMVHSSSLPATMPESVPQSGEHHGRCSSVVRLLNPSSMITLHRVYYTQADQDPIDMHPSSRETPPSLPLTVSAFLHLDGTRVVGRVIGLGGTGIVIERGQLVDGVPMSTGRLTPEPGNYDERPDLIRSIQDEKAIYRRLGDHPGIVRCFDLSSDDPSLQMDLMKNGDLRHYLAEKRPKKSTQLSWLASMAHTMSYIHGCRIIIADIRLDNLLLTEDLCVKFSDFGESAMMPLDWDLNGSDDVGFSIMTDIGQFGAVMFEIVTGQRCKFDLAQGWREPGDMYTWPRRDSLPSTINVWLGHIIEECWTRGITSAKDLAAELDREKVSELE
ncbi:hypothetical protein FQN51_008057 [Onygenales sp. PD_10]|nr:hypothetical protein FQN51_008057 [Onygenales sp. PD_10]